MINPKEILGIPYWKTEEIARAYNPLKERTIELDVWFKRGCPGSLIVKNVIIDTNPFPYEIYTYEPYCIMEKMNGNFFDEQILPCIISPQRPVFLHINDKEIAFNFDSVNCYYSYRSRLAYILKSNGINTGDYRIKLHLVELTFLGNTARCTIEHIKRVLDKAITQKEINRLYNYYMNDEYTDGVIYIVEI